MKSLEYPKGFRLYRHPPNSFKVTYRTKGMGCMVTFLGVLLTVTLVFCLSWFFRTPPQERATVFQEILANVFQNWFLPILVLAGLLGRIFGYFGALFVFLWKVFGITTFEIEPHVLLVTKRLFGRQIIHRILRAEMVELEQVKDGGEGEDSFPSWGLKLHASKTFNLLTRERLEKSDWLGQFLADYYGLNFKKSPQRHFGFWRKEKV
jgi:hypothetical protein